MNIGKLNFKPDSGLFTIFFRHGLYKVYFYSDVDKEKKNEKQSPDFYLKLQPKIKPSVLILSTTCNRSYFVLCYN